MLVLFVQSYYASELEYFKSLSEGKKENGNHVKKNHNSNTHNTDLQIFNS